MQIKPICENCAKSSYCGQDATGGLLFGCNNSFCVFEPIINNSFRDEMKEIYKNNKEVKSWYGSKKQ